jgi:uncharacterized repeat protein (TIGR02543 family)
MRRTGAKRVLTLALAVVMALALSLSFGAPAAYADETGSSEGLTFTLPAVEAKVYDDWSWRFSVNYYYRELNLTDNTTSTITWDSGLDGNQARPSDFAMAIVAGDSVSLDGATVTAQKPGTTVISLSGSNTPASSTAYAIVEVTDENTSDLKIATSLVKDYSTPRLGQDINQYNIIYFKDGQAIAKDFDVSAPGAVSLAVSVNGGAWETKLGAAASFTAQLENRQNIIGIRATDSEGKVRTFYKTVDARFVEIQTSNVSRPGESLAKGDTASVFVKGITLPNWKTPGGSNPQHDSINFPTDIGISSFVRYFTDDYDTYGAGWIAARAGQYNLATGHRFTLVLNKAGTLHFTGGDIVLYAWGGGLEEDSTKGSHVYYGAPQARSVSGQLPAFTINVAQGPSVPTTDLEFTEKSILSPSWSEPFTSATLPEYLSEDDMFNQDVTNTYCDWTFNVRVSPANADNRNIVWTSSDPDVATVYHGPARLREKANRDAAYGIFMFIKPGRAGTTTITGTVEGTDISRSFTVNVEEQTPIISKLDPPSIYPGDTVTITNTNDSMTLGRAQHAMRTLTGQGATGVSAVYRYDTDLPGLSSVDSGAVHFTQNAMYGAPIPVVNTLTFQIPNGADVSHTYHLTGGRIVVKYTLDGEQLEQDVPFREGALEDLPIVVLDPDNFAMMPEDIYPGTTVTLMIGKIVPDNPTIQEVNANGGAGNQILGSTKYYKTDIPGLPAKVETATQGGRVIQFTVPEGTEPGEYHLTDPSYYTQWQFNKAGQIVGKGYANVPINNSYSQGMLSPLTITVKEKPVAPPRYAYIDVERGTIGQGLFVEPVKIQLTDDMQTVADLIDEVIGDKGVYPVEWAGNYLSAVKEADTGEVAIPEYIAWLDGDPDNGPFTADAISHGKSPDYEEADTLAELDYSDDAGWMYSINNAFGSNGIKQQELNDGDVVRLAFSYYGHGMDLGSTLMGGEPAPPFKERYEFANFDELVKQMAEANAAIEEANAAVDDEADAATDEEESPLEGNEGTDEEESPLEGNEGTDEGESPPDIDFDALSLAYADADALLNNVVAWQAQVDYTAAQIEAILGGGAYTSYEEVVGAAVEDALSELDTALAGYDRTKYTDAEWAQVQAAYETGAAAIAAAPTEEAVQRALDAAKSAMAAVTATKVVDVPAEDETTEITIEADEGVLPAETKLNVELIEEDSPTLATVKQVLADVGEKVLLYDIKLINTALQAIQPNGEVKISLPVPSGMDSARIEVYRIEDNGARTLLKSEVKNGRLAFYTDHFSLYAIVERAVPGNVDNNKQPPALKSYTVKFDANGGKGLSAKSIVVSEKGKYGKLPTVKRTGYKFLGWYTAKKGGTKVTADMTLIKNADQTLYAHWKAKKYKVSLNANGGKVSGKKLYTRTVTFDKGYGTLAKAKRAGGYKFVGWYTARSSGKKITSAKKVKTAKAHTLYARWLARYGKPDGVSVIKVRDAARTSAAVKGYVSASVKFRVTEKVNRKGDDDWYKVSYKTKAGKSVTGYVYAPYVKTYWAGIAG